MTTKRVRKKIWVLDDTVGPALSLYFLLWVNNVPYCLKFKKWRKDIASWAHGQRPRNRGRGKASRCWVVSSVTGPWVATLRFGKAKAEASTQPTQGSSRQTWSTYALTSVTEPVVLGSSPCLGMAGSLSRKSHASLTSPASRTWLVKAQILLLHSRSSSSGWNSTKLLFGEVVEGRNGGREPSK